MGITFSLEDNVEGPSLPLDEPQSSTLTCSSLAGSFLGLFERLSWKIGFLLRLIKPRPSSSFKNARNPFVSLLESIDLELPPDRFASSFGESMDSSSRRL